MNNTDEKYYSYINSDGKKVSGTASYLHAVKSQGGVDAYEKKLVMKAIEGFIDNCSATTRHEIYKDVQKSNLKVI